jgi:hypothetical protein
MGKSVCYFFQTHWEDGTVIATLLSEYESRLKKKLGGGKLKMGSTSGIFILFDMFFVHIL